MLTRLFQCGSAIYAGDMTMNVFDTTDWATIIFQPGLSGRRKRFLYNELNRVYGDGNWRVGWQWREGVILFVDAIQLYEESYAVFLKSQQDLLEWLLTSFRDVYDTAPSNINSGIEYSIQETRSAHYNDIAIRRVVRLTLKRNFQGSDLLQVRSNDHCKGRYLSPFFVPFIAPSLILPSNFKARWTFNSVEAFWQHNKIIQIKSVPNLLALPVPILERSERGSIIAIRWK